MCFGFVLLTCVCVLLCVHVSAQMRAVSSLMQGWLAPCSNAPQKQNQSHHMLSHHMQTKP